MFQTYFCWPCDRSSKDKIDAPDIVTQKSNFVSFLLLCSQKLLTKKQVT